MLSVADLLLYELGQCSELRSKILIVNKTLLFMTHIHECSIQPWHQFLNLTKVDVSYRIRFVLHLSLIFSKLAVFEKANRNLFGRNIYHYFTSH